MTNPADSSVSSTPRHLWIVGVVGLLWNAVGAWDYLMTQTRNESYMASFSPEQLEYFYGFPVWVVSAWAIAVWGGVLGCILLLMRKRATVPVFLASLLAMIVTTVHNYILSDGLEVAGGWFPVVFTGLIFIVAVALYAYARRMRERGVLG